MDRAAADRLNKGLLIRIAQGDRQAFDDFYRGNASMVQAFLRKKGMTPGPSEEDILQEIFIKVWQKSHYYNDGKGRPINWLLSISQNCLIDYWRRAKRSNLMTDLSPEDMAETQELSVNPQKEHWLTIQKAIDGLNQDDQSLFKMIYLQGLTMKECSQKLGIPDGTVKWRINHIVKKMRVEVTS